MPMIARCLVGIVCSLVSSAAQAYQDEPPGMDDVGEVGVSPGEAQRRITVHLETAHPKPGERPFVSLDPVVLPLAATPVAALKTVPPLRSAKARYGVLRLGRSGRQVFVLDQSDPARDRYDLLWLDRNRDLAFDAPDEATPIQGVVVRDEVRELDYVEFTAVPIDVYFGVRVDEAGNERSDIEKRSFTFYAWHPRTGILDSIYLMAASWREGVATIDGVEARVVIHDEGGNALIATDQARWALLELPSSAPLPPELELTSAKIALRFAGRPYRIVALDPEGRVLEIGEESEASMLQALLDNDPLQSEPPRPRTDKPVVWLTSFAEAEAKAKAESKPICVLYTAEWSRYARLLDERTLLDAEVSRLLREKFVCVRLNPAKERLLAARHAAELVPTLVLLGKDGAVLDRSVGYRPPRTLADDLRRWR